MAKTEKDRAEAFEKAPETDLTVKVKVKFDGEPFALIAEAAYLSGMTPKAYIRSMAVKAAIADVTQFYALMDPQADEEPEAEAPPAEAAPAEKTAKKPAPKNPAAKPVAKKPAPKKAPVKKAPAK